MKALLLPGIILVIALLIGIAFRKSPYQLRGEGQPYDQAALDHRDSPYSHVTWVTSHIGNYAQLRFFDKIEGGICLEPSWPQLQELAATDPNLAHLKAGSEWTFKPEPGDTWPEGMAHPDMGTVSNTKYTCLYPAGVLMNEGLMQAAGGDARKAAPNVLVVGLGSGVGISVLAHHFPEASINVVDIDRAVIDMVNEHYPFFRWLQSQKTSDGRPRLAVHAADARQFILFPELRKDEGMKYDLVILDAYTSGSTIPSHLMTVEYYQSIRELVMNDDAILLSNIIGSYSGEKRYVLGGAIRSMQEAGYDSVYNLPIIYPMYYDVPPLRTDRARNNVVLASTQALDPTAAPRAWQRLEEWSNYPELPTDRFISSYVMQAKINEYGNPVASSAGASISDEHLAQRVWDAVRKKHNEELTKLRKEHGKRQFAYYQDDDIFIAIDDSGLIEEVSNDVAAQGVKVRGWRAGAQQLLIHRTDWIRFCRRTWQRSVIEAKYADHSGEAIVNRHVPDAPLYTDARPNADILNR